MNWDYGQSLKLVPDATDMCLIATLWYGNNLMGNTLKVYVALEFILSCVHSWLQNTIYREFPLHQNHENNLRNFCSESGLLAIRTLYPA